MTMAAEKQIEKIGTTKGCEDHDYDLIRELSRRLGFLWHCDQYIANADGNTQLQSLWRDLKKNEQDCVKRLRQQIADEVSKGCF
jgi:hypothetical protein